MKRLNHSLEFFESLSTEIPLKDCFESYLEILKFRNPALYSHSQKVGICAYLLTLALGYPSKVADLMQYAGWVHDIGGIFLPINMHFPFLKGELYHMPQWQQIYKLHPLVGAKILKNLSPLNVGTNDFCSIILHHHENWDGSGFPKGLKDKEIPEGARILRVADALVRKIDAPPQGEGKSLKDALFEMLEGSKKFFDPKLIAELIHIEDTIKVWLNLVEENEKKTELTWNNLGDEFDGSIKENTCCRG